MALALCVRLVQLSLIVTMQSFTGYFLGDTIQFTMIFLNFPFHLWLQPPVAMSVPCDPLSLAMVEMNVSEWIPDPNLEIQILSS